jgi:DNA polymerase-3 subunit gamma/tau
MLLKGLFEVRDSARPIVAAEMALIRLAYAADLPPTDKLLRNVMEQGTSQTSTTARLGSPASGRHAGEVPAYGGTAVPGNVSAQALPRAEAASASAETMTISSLADLAALAAAKGASVLKVQIENHVHLVRFEPGQIEFRPAAAAPRTLAGDLAQKLKEWTGSRWVVTVAREGGEPTLAEQRKAAHAHRLEQVAQEPMVRAVLDRFPGAEIVAVRDRNDDIPPSTEEA